MSLFGSLMGDVDEDPFFGSHMRHMRQMNNMMNSLFTNPFGMLGGMESMMGPLAIGGPRQGGYGQMNSMSMMPFMPQMPSFNRLFSDLEHGMGPGGMGPGGMGPGGMGSSYSSSTVVMSSGPNGKPQVFSSSSSTKIGPNGVKETRKTLQDSRTGTKKMSIGHHIGERAHVVEREQNVYSGDAEENQEFINIEEDEAEDFDREFQTKAGALTNPPLAITSSRPAPPPVMLALPAPAATATALPPPASVTSATHGATIATATESNGSPSPRVEVSRRPRRPAPRRPIRTTASPLATSSSPSVREVYAGSQPLRHARHPHRSHKRHDH